MIIIIKGSQLWKKLKYLKLISCDENYSNSAASNMRFKEEWENGPVIVMRWDSLQWNKNNDRESLPLFE